MKNKIHRTDEPLFKTLKEIAYFKDGCVICLDRPTQLACHLRGRHECLYREYPKGSYLIRHNKEWKIYGNSTPVKPFDVVKSYEVMEVMPRIFHAMLTVAKNAKGKQIFIRQHGKHRGKAYFNTWIHNQTIFDELDSYVEIQHAK